MSILSACRGLSGRACSGIARPRFLGHVFSLCIALATSQLFAQQSVPANDGNVYLERYAKQLTLLQQSRFSFSGSLTRSTPKLGWVATWENSGTVRVSARCKSFHCTSAATLTKAKEAKTPDYLGIRERLVTPAVFLDVSILEERAPSMPRKRFSVDVKGKSSDDEWANEMGRNEFGILLGYVLCDEDRKSLLAVSRGAPSELLTDKASDSMSLSGFLVKHEDMEVRTCSAQWLIPWSSDCRCYGRA